MKYHRVSILYHFRRNETGFEGVACYSHFVEYHFWKSYIRRNEGTTPLKIKNHLLFVGVKQVTLLNHLLIWNTLTSWLYILISSNITSNPFLFRFVSFRRIYLAVHSYFVEYHFKPCLVLFRFVSANTLSCILPHWINWIKSRTQKPGEYV